MSRGDSWIFRHACGCAFGLVDVTSRADTASRAWREMFETVRKRDAALDRGVTATREPWDQYRHTVYDQLRGGCPHGTTASAP